MLSRTRHSANAFRLAAGSSSGGADHAARVPRPAGTELLPPHLRARPNVIPNQTPTRRRTPRTTSPGPAVGSRISTQASGRSLVHKRSSIRRWRLVSACRDFLCPKPVSAINDSYLALSASLETDTEMLIGYARGSTDDQNLALRLDAVKQAPAAGRVFRDVNSGGSEAAPPSSMRALSLSDRLRPPLVRPPRAASLRADRLRPLRGG